MFFFCGVGCAREHGRAHTLFLLPKQLKKIPQTNKNAPQKVAAAPQVGPELEVPGYGCEDHFLELDTVEHSWECIAVRFVERS